MSGKLYGQALNYKNELQKNYYELVKQNKAVFQVFNPKCMVIIGSSNNSYTDDQKRSFELYRSDSKQIEILTFNELFQKAQMLVSLLEK